MTAHKRPCLDHPDLFPARLSHLFLLLLLTRDTRPALPHVRLRLSLHLRPLEIMRFPRQVMFIRLLILRFRSCLERDEKSTMDDYVGCYEWVAGRQEGACVGGYVLCIEGVFGIKCNGTHVCFRPRFLNLCGNVTIA
ncbi:hypothetical protein BDZ85DRAFT_38219 [Elsinoe ampelina]|uniref:Uncharacterized protein n=1 Tax=Elsinoe ampelina TaxID=302913 RepID=A0A6A6G395_9PEZI|nr:hypothetical protein BDZ85DRAFT_38219 [Elsinoe ampelina]